MNDYRFVNDGHEQMKKRQNSGLQNSRHIHVDPKNEAVTNLSNKKMLSKLGRLIYIYFFVNLLKT